jgi:hypothetical protein
MSFLHYFCISYLFFQSYLGEINGLIRFPLYNSKLSVSSSSGRNLQDIPVVTGPQNIQLTNFQNEIYNLNLTIGSNLQPFSLTVDTGSSWLWVTDINGIGVDFAFNHFSCESSLTCHPTTTRVPLAYADNSEGEGFMIADTVNLSGGYVIPSQEMILIDYTKNFENFSADGIIGFGFRNWSDNFPTFLDRLVSQGTLTQMNFSMYLSDTSQENYTNDTTSELILGGYDVSYFYDVQSTFKYFALVATDSWSIGFNSLGFNEANISNSSVDQVLIDSGTSYIVLPDDMWVQLTNAIISFSPLCSTNTDVDGGLYLSCTPDDYDSFVASLPDIVFVLGVGVELTEFPLSATFYMRKMDHKSAVLLIFSSQSGDFMLGAEFLRSYYSFFHHTDRKIGFVRAKLDLNNIMSNNTNHGASP